MPGKSLPMKGAIVHYSDLPRPSTVIKGFLIQVSVITVKTHFSRMSTRNRGLPIIIKCIINGEVRLPDPGEQSNPTRRSCLKVILIDFAER